MKNQPGRTPDRNDDVDAIAAAWIAQCDDGDDPAQQAKFARWRAEDPSHEAAAARLENTQHLLRRLRGFRPEAVRHPDAELLRRENLRGRRPLSLAGTFAAVAAVLAVALVIFFNAPRQNEDTALRFATEKGGYICQTLEDGSLLELNAASEVRVRYTASGRYLRLLYGEAHFKVAKDPGRPFFVETDTVTVRAVGTAFNVRVGSADVEVLVTEGRVAISPKPASARESQQRTQAGSDIRTSGPAATSPASALAELRANERLVIAVARVTEQAVGTRPPVVETVSNETIHKALSWLGPRLMFDQTPLREAVRQFNQRSFSQIELADDALGDLPISGSFRTENAEAFVRLISSGNDIIAERPEPARIVLRQAK